jgi:hypothetical protein
MEIIIKRPSNDDLLEHNYIKWKLFSNRYIILLVYAVMGIFFLVGNWLTLKDGEYFWGFISSFGLSLVFLSLFYFSHIYQYKRKYLSRTKQILNRYKNQNEGVEIKITDKLVSYKDLEAYSEMKWTYFTEFKLYNNYLILIIDKQSLNSIIVNRNEISGAQFTELLEFVKNKLPERGK